MKLLLTANGLVNKSIIKALEDLTTKPFNNLTLAFIPTAAMLDVGDKSWLIRDLNNCLNLGLKAIDVVDISANPQKMWFPRIDAADIIVFGGGNAYYLNYWINITNLDQYLPELLKNKIYVGISAGSAVATPSLVLTRPDKKGTLVKMGEVAKEKGLGLVNFLVKPHINSPHFPERTFKNLLEEVKTIPFPVYGLDNQSAIN